MSSDAQKFANRDNAKKSTGPKTLKGKAIASRNSSKGGARSGKLMSISEVECFNTIVDALFKKYPSDNPLIKIQIERIAKIKVQLDRVQSLIDKVFEESNLPSAIDEYLLKLLDFNDEQRSSLKDALYDNNSKALDTEKIEVAQELLSSDALSSHSHEELMKKCPSFCEYLHREAISLNTSLAVYVSYLESSFGSYQNLEAQIAMKLMKIVTKANRKEELELKDAVLSVPFEALLKVASKFVGYPATLADTDLKIALYKTLKFSNLIPSQPNYDSLNNLYRYQTTLQKHLSSTIGELLALDAKEHF